MILTNDTFIMFAMKHYAKPSCKTLAEFESDILRFITIKKQLNIENHDVKRLLNHIQIQYNLFDSEACTQMLFHKAYKHTYPALKSYLVFLSYMPENEMVDVQLDQRVVDQLRMI